ncbi:MAG: VOC family protein [Alphaproteobacteria bacterium]|nr:VOC family protein [Alphaproteobacteria bacterium]MBV9693681.1 VOC family protein [Alphaproteobacteria bacterium]
MSESSEFYPMPGFATFAVRDLGVSCVFYESLGFRTVFVMPGPGGKPQLAHLRWARYADLLLKAETAPEARPKGLGLTVSFAVSDGALEGLTERARSLGAKFVHEPGDRPWNARDFTLADPDGFALTFAMGPLNRDLALDQVVANAARAS